MVRVADRTITKSVTFCGPVRRCSSSSWPTTLSGLAARNFISEVRPLPSSEPTASTARTTSTAQRPIVRQGCSALVRARRSVRPLLLPTPVFPLSLSCDMTILQPRCP